MPFNKNIYKSNSLVTLAKLGNCKEKAYKKIIETNKTEYFCSNSTLIAYANFNFISLNTKEV